MISLFPRLPDRLPFLGWLKKYRLDPLLKGLVVTVRDEWRKVDLPHP